MTLGSEGGQLNELPSRSTISATRGPTLSLRIIRVREVAPLIGALLLVSALQLLSDGKFFTTQQFVGMTNIMAAVGVIAVAVTVLMIAGEFDLSVSAVFALTPIALATFTIEYGWNQWMAFFLAMLIAATVGLVNGLITVTLRIPSFISTLGALFVIGGINYVWTGGAPKSAYNDQSRLLSLLGGRLFGDAFLFAPFVWMLVLAFVVWFVLERTRFGNWVFASGGRSPAARAMGVPVAGVRLGCFIACSMLSGFAGCASYSQLRIVSAGYGANYNLLAIVAAVVGGASLFGVVGSITGSLIGAFVLAALQTGLVLIGAPGAWYTSLIGVILVVNVVFNTKVDQRRIKLGAL